MTAEPGSGPVLIVTGLAAEARLLEGPDTICVSAPPASLTAKIAAASAHRRPCALVSFGLAGGLEPGLPAGAIVVASRVIADGTTWETDSSLSGKLLQKLAGLPLGSSHGAMAACDAPVITAQGKSALHRRTHAIAVDTESHIAARFAAERDLPFAVLRAVCDTAEADLPPLAYRAIDPDGRLDMKAIAEELLRRPGQLVQLPGTALATAKAMRTLSRVRRFLGPRLSL
ncbi:phosphorylase family protein [Aureimonas psammosilenae]|uniref:phosphorylase family protein n=1 Tax=Aureimonas psammosilenae TaxID=2495496 RepID=UPI00186A2E62|nr:phosphorylase [Aureimonas psammosilenae]